MKHYIAVLRSNPHVIEVWNQKRMDEYEKSRVKVTPPYVILGYVCGLEFYSSADNGISEVIQEVWSQVFGDKFSELRQRLLEKICHKLRYPVIESNDLADKR